MGDRAHVLPPDQRLAGSHDPRHAGARSGGGRLTFEEFERRAWQEWERIPDEYRAGVDGLVIERAALPHPTLADVYTLGECLTESYPSDYGGPDTTRSVVVLYYGSFFRLSRLDDEFDWEGELWETLTHELQHHLESLAADDALVDMDYAADENHKRYEGEPFDPFFFRQGLPTDGWFRVDDEFFLEAPWPAPGAPVHFEWDGSSWEIEPPPDPADIAFLTVGGHAAASARALHIVLVARHGWVQTIRRLIRGGSPVVVQLDVEPRSA